MVTESGNFCREKQFKKREGRRGSNGRFGQNLTRGGGGSNPLRRNCITHYRRGGLSIGTIREDA